MSDMEEDPSSAKAEENEERYRSQLKTRRLYECAIKMTITLKDLYFENKKQKEDIDRYRENIQILEKKLFSVKDDLSEAQDREKQRDEEGREEVEALEQELLSLKASIAEAREGTKRDLEREEHITELEAELLSLKSSYAQAQADLENVKEENKEVIESLRRELQLTQERLSSAEDVVNVTTEKLEKVTQLLEETNEERKSEIEKTKEMCLSIRKLEEDLKSTMAVADERNVTYAKNISEKQLELEEQVKENEALVKQLMEEKAKCAALQRNYDKKVADVTIHNDSLQDLMQELVELRANYLAELDSHKIEITSMKSTLGSVQKSLKLSVKWLLYFGKKLQEMGYLASDPDELKLFSNLMNLSQHVDEDNHLDVFCSSLDTLNIPLPSTSGTSRDNVQGEQSFKTRRRSAVALITLDNENSETPNDMSNSSVGEIACPILMFPQMLSTPLSTRRSQNNFEGRSLPLKRTCPRGDSRLRTTDAVRTHLPSNATPRMDTAENSSLDEITPNIRFGNNKEILISFPITPLLKEQSVNLRYNRDRVQVGYKQSASDCSEAISSSQEEEYNGPPNPAKRSRVDSDSDVIVLDSDDNDNAAPAPMENAVAIDPRDIPSCSSVPLVKLEGNRLPFNPPGHHASQEEHDVICLDMDEDQEVLALAPESRFNHFGNASNLPNEVTCPEVVHALNQLVDTQDDDEELNVKCEQLKTSLQKCTDSQASIAARVTLSFFCSRNVNPLQEYLTSNDEHHLFPLNELCVVKAYNNMDRSIFRIKLEDVLYKEIVGRGGNWNIFVLSTLCRVWAYLKGLKKAIHCVRAICYDLLKRYPDTAPFLIAAIVSVFSTALEPPVIESEKCMYQVLRYMITNKPRNLQDDLWNPAKHLIMQYLPPDTVLTPEDIIDCAVHNFMDKSSDVEFITTDAKNYVDAIEILSSRFDWPWVNHFVISKFLVPLIEAYSATPRRKSCGAAALAFRIIGSLGSGQCENGELREFVKSAYANMLKKIGNVPTYVYEEARYAVFILETGRKEIGINGTPFKEWAVQNGYIIT